MVAERRFEGADSGYKSHSGSFVETLEDLKTKTEFQMAEARRFEAQGQLTTDTADLKMKEDVLAEDTAALEDTTRVCQAKAVEFETATNGRSEELDAYAKARAVISQKTGGAESFSYGLTQASFLRLSRSVLSPSGGLTKFEAVWKTKELAKREHSPELAQLASRVASAVHVETGDVQHVVHTVEVERPRIIKQTVQKPIIQEKINRVTEHVEGQLSQFTDKVVGIPVVVQRQIPIAVQTVQKTIESSQLQDIDEVVDVPVGLVEQVPLVCVMAETAEISQLTCETCVKDNMFLIAGEINVARKIRGQVDVECVRQHTEAAALKRQLHSIKQQPNEQTAQEREGGKKMRGQVEREKGQGERERGERGKKEEETGEKGKEVQEETYEEDMRKLLEMVEREEMELEMMQQEEMEHEEQRGRVAPSMGAGGSHPQAMSEPRKMKETRGLRWADCNDEEGKGNEEEVEEQKEVGQRERTDERLPGLAEEQENELKTQQEEKLSQRGERRRRERKRGERRRRERKRGERRRRERKRGERRRRERKRGERRKRTRKGRLRRSEWSKREK